MTGYNLTSKWKYGVVIQRLGLLHYLVELDDRYKINRHYDQLRPSNIDMRNYFSNTSEYNDINDTVISSELSVPLEFKESKDRETNVNHREETRKTEIADLTQDLQHVPIHYKETSDPRLKENQ